MSTHQGSPASSGGFLGLPGTTLGRISVAALVAGIVFGVLTSTVFESVSASIGRLNIIGAVGFLIFLAALLTGATALIRDRERSWAVWLSTALPGLGIGFEVLSLLIPGE